MKNNLLSLLLVLLTVLTSCAQKKISATAQQAATTTQQTATVSAPAPVITYVRMERTPCFGRCPHYALELRDDGMARYSGYRFTDHQGVYEIGIGPLQAKDLLAKLAAYRPDTCQSDYEVLISDIPGVNYRMEFSNQEMKEIRNGHFGPSFLMDFAKSLDDLLQVDDSWRIISDSASYR